MIRRLSDITLDTNPPMHPTYWWCGCGNTEKAETIIEETPEEIATREWKKINNEI